MFLGQYRHTIDSKGRLIVPARFRDNLNEGGFITQGFDRNLMVLTSQAFESITRRVNELSLTDETARQLRRLIYATADRVEVDKTGRIRIPQFLLEIARFQSDAVVVGVGAYFEIWSPEAWDSQEELLQDPDANAHRFAALDLTTGP
jgi:MraZ protein